MKVVFKSCKYAWKGRLPNMKPKKESWTNSCVDFIVEHDAFLPILPQALNMGSSNMVLSKKSLFIAFN